MPIVGTLRRGLRNWVKSSDMMTMADEYFEWEGKVEGLDKQIGELEAYSSQRGIDYSVDINKLRLKRDANLRKLYSKLGAWQTVEVARHPNRPVMKDYLGHMVRDFRELHGDRCYGDDRAIVCGLGRIGRHRVMVIGNNKRGVKLASEASEEEAAEYSRVYSGCSNPEGFRKALVKMKFAEKFGISIVTLIDTPGAYPGIGAEERGQAYTIAKNLEEMSRLRVPIVSVLIGEGGSGGALGLCGGANKFGALEYSWYSVISPEGCAAILFRNGNNKEKAAEVLKLSAKDGHKFGAIDDIIGEGLGGAHRNCHDVIAAVEKYIVGGLKEFGGMSGDELVAQRWEMVVQRGGKYLKKGGGLFSKRKGGR